MKQFCVTFCILAAISSLHTDSVMAQDPNTPDFKVDLDPSNCQFSGGSDGLGNVTVNVNTGGKKIQVKLINDNGFEMNPSVAFDGEGADQMNASGGGKTVNIFNRNDAPADVYYGIDVTNPTTGESKTCDPKITNVP